LHLRNFTNEGNNIVRLQQSEEKMRQNLPSFHQLLNTLAANLFL